MKNFNSVTSALRSIAPSAQHRPFSILLNNLGMTCFYLGGWNMLGSATLLKASNRNIPKNKGGKLSHLTTYRPTTYRPTT